MGAQTAVLTGITLLAFAANSVLCRLALGAGAIDAASFTAVRLVSGALMLLGILALKSQKAPGPQGSWASTFWLALYPTDPPTCLTPRTSSILGRIVANTPGVLTAASAPPRRIRQPRHVRLVPVERNPCRRAWVDTLELDMGPRIAVVLLISALTARAEIMSKQTLAALKGNKTKEAIRLLGSDPVERYGEDTFVPRALFAAMEDHLRRAKRGNAEECQGIIVAAEKLAQGAEDIYGHFRIMLAARLPAMRAFQRRAAGDAKWLDAWTQGAQELLERTEALERHHCTLPPSACISRRERALPLEFVEYQGGHGWGHRDLWLNLKGGFAWLEKTTASRPKRSRSARSLSE